jgi:hypothetical protein
MVSKELDFRFEADHLRAVRKALESMYQQENNETNDNETQQQQDILLYTTNGVPFQVKIPKPLDDLCNCDV